MFQKYLPPDFQLESETRGALSLAKIFSSKQKMLSFAAHSDLRMAQILAVGRYLSRTLPVSLDLPQIENGVWAYGVQRSLARTESILEAVNLWARGQWLVHKFLLEPVELDRVVPSELQKNWLPNAKKLLALTMPLSFFESEAGIMHVKFAAIALQTVDGKNLLATHMGLNNENPWPQVVTEIWWQNQVLTNQAEELNSWQLKRLQQLQTANLFELVLDNQHKTTWPPLRIDAISGLDLSQTPGDVPGHLWCASALGGEPVGNKHV